MPIIVLSVRASDEDKVRLLEGGADDYVVKPFSMVELLARARAAIRRQARGTTGESVVRAGPLTIDLSTRAVFVNEARVILSPKEYRLLQVLAQHAGNVVTHNMLLKEVWGARHLQNGALSAHSGAQAAPKDRAGPEAPAHSAERARRRLPARERHRLGLTSKKQTGPGRRTALSSFLVVLWGYLLDISATPEPSGCRRSLVSRRKIAPITSVITATTIGYQSP